MIMEVNMREVQKNRVYKHFKGNYYLLVDTGLDSETLEELVIYRKLYNDGALWIRPLDDFLGEVDHEKYPDVKQKYKFELQEIEDARKSFQK